MGRRKKSEIIQWSDVGIDKLTTLLITTQIKEYTM